VEPFYIVPEIFLSEKLRQYPDGVMVYSGSIRRRFRKRLHKMIRALFLFLPNLNTGEAL
jgi:hypothetical protein